MESMTALDGLKDLYFIVRTTGECVSRVAWLRLKLWKPHQTEKKKNSSWYQKEKNKKMTSLKWRRDQGRLRSCLQTFTVQFLMDVAEKGHEADRNLKSWNPVFYSWTRLHVRCQSNRTYVKSENALSHSSCFFPFHVSGVDECEEITRK